MTEPIPTPEDAGLPPMAPTSDRPRDEWTIEVPEVKLDDDGNLADEVLCRRCGYVLRGLSIEGRCPECGTAVGWSVHGDLLRFSDPIWAEHLAGGTLWLIVAALGTIVATVAGAILDGTVGNEVGSSILGLVVAGISLVGYWRVTMEDPGQPDKGASLRLWTRILAVAGSLASLVTLCAVFVGSMSAATVLGILLVVTMAASIVGSVLLFILMRRLARRIPNEGLARQTTVVMIGTVISGSLGVIGAGSAILAVLTEFGGGMTAGPVVIVGGLGMCAGMIGVFVFWIWWVVLLFIYRNALKRESGYARATWMAANPAPPEPV